ncbi:MAG: nucleotidyl transferase AbiEii/AbiGii toxin family protein [Chloroflexota bacterium]
MSASGASRVSVRVATPAVMVVLKGLAMGERDKPKDAYDIDFLLRHAGVDDIAAGIAEFNSVEPVRRALSVLAAKLATVDTIGATSVALYRRAQLRSTEADELQALAFARVQRLLDLLRQGAL